MYVVLPQTKKGLQTVETVLQARALHETLRRVMR